MRRSTTTTNASAHPACGAAARAVDGVQVESVVANTPVEIEVFGFGGLCVMVEGRCALSAYATGESPGACSPGKHVRWEDTPRGMETRLNGILIDRFADGERAGYRTLCKGRFEVNDETYYALEEPTSLNTLEPAARASPASASAQSRSRAASAARPMSPR